MGISALLEVKAYPDKSPLEGGGQLALLFGGQLPRGPKWLSFISQQRPEYIHQVEALEENFMALSTMIPKHDIPETVTLQVVCSGQVVAQTDFMYYANAQYNSDLLFQYLVQNFPGYFPEVNGDGGMGPSVNPGGSAGGTGYPAGGYYNNVPHTSYNLLLGSCRLGIEELVFATLQLPSMTKINMEQLRKAQQLCEEHNHPKLAEVMQVLVDLAAVAPRGSVGEEGEEEESVLKREEAQKALAKLDVAVNAEEGGVKILDRLRQILKMAQRSILEEEREQQVPSSPIIQPPSPVLGEKPLASPIVEDSDSPSQQRRLSSSNKLMRQDQSVIEDDELTPPPVEIHSRKSIAEKDDQLPPLPLRPLPNRRGGIRKPFISTHSDAADSAVSMSFDRDGDFELEVARRNSAGLALSGLYSSSLNGAAISISIDPEAGHDFANCLQFECVYLVTEDYPPNCDATNVIFKAGDKILQIGDADIQGKGPEDFAELLQKEAVKGTSVRILPRVSPPPSLSINSSLGYSSLDTSAGRSLVKKPSDNQMMDSITMKVSNLLSMKGSGFRRSITLPYIESEKGFGFRFIGGNAVGLFVSEVSQGKKELQVGDQILEIAGQSAVQMSYCEAQELMSQAKDKLQLKVAQNNAKYQSIRDQFEFESFYLRCDVDHTPSDTKDMALNKGSLVRVVNSVLYPDAWLAWSVDEATGIDMELRRIPSPRKAYLQYGKQVYQPVIGPQMQTSDKSPRSSSPLHQPQNIMVS